MKIMDILAKDAVILDLGVRTQARGARRDGGVAGQGRAADRRRAACSRCCSSARRCRAPASARASRSPTGSSRASTAWWRPSRAAVAGVDFDSIDGQPTHHFFLLVVPEHSGGQYLKALARISRFFRDAAFRRRARRGRDPRGRDPRHRGRRRQALTGAAGHGALVEVGGLGVLLLGPSGIGKSECALELVRRGHRLVADDVVEVERNAAGERDRARRCRASATTWRSAGSASCRCRTCSAPEAVRDSARGRPGLPARRAATPGRELRARRHRAADARRSPASRVPRVTLPARPARQPRDAGRGGGARRRAAPRRASTPRRGSTTRLRREMGEVVMTRTRVVFVSGPLGQRQEHRDGRARGRSASTASTTCRRR